MPSHLITDPTATGTAVFPAAPGWMALSAAMTAEVPVIAERDDLVVTIAPGAGHGAPACYLRAQASIEVDGTHLGAVDPATARPHLVSDRTRYATVWGLLTHECAHARHSAWHPPDGAPPGAVMAAQLLEEPRIEAAQILRRPRDWHWLRASVTNIILNDMRAADPAHDPTMSRHNAAKAAALLLARVPAGVLTPIEVRPVRRTVETILGKEVLYQLRSVWNLIFDVADDDGETMIELGRRWCEILGEDPTARTPPAPGTSAPHAPGTPGGETATDGPTPLSDAITEAVGKITRAVARAEAPAEPTTRAARATKPATDGTAEKVAQRVFAAPGGTTDRHTRLTGTRPPTTTERTAARTLARALSTAGTRDRVASKTTSAVPPGRLRMRGALAAAAQRAAGAIPTAEPFTRTTRTTVPTPPLRLGIACDVSGSMYAFAAPVASAAWILAHAAHHTRVPATTATVIFGEHVRPITHPGTAPAAVTQFDTRDDWEAIDVAIPALDGALGLSRPDAARLLVIISDGKYRDQPRRDGQRHLDRLRATGCGVLWLATGTYDAPLDGATVHVMTNPINTAQAIGRAATKALRATR
ncbi:hypothetical protein [Actinoalloteichus caeruleus]|uniref:hypothetical protein n=1 Tax=Actinoalloteichus cyanogriseus TaxID=2893586 RepID=UPI003BB98B9C